MQGAQSFSHIGTQANQRTSWDDTKKRCLLELLRENSYPDSQQKKGWSQDTWKKVTEIMQGNFPGSNIDIGKLKFLERDMKKHVYKPVKAILDTYPGCIQWDSKNSMLDASNETWATVVKDYPEAIKWRSKIIPYYHDLAALYEGHPQGAPGENGWSASMEFSSQPKLEFSSQPNQSFPITEEEATAETNCDNRFQSSSLYNLDDIANFLMSCPIPNVPANHHSTQIHLPTNTPDCTITPQFDPSLQNMQVPQPPSSQETSPPTEFMNTNTKSMFPPFNRVVKPMIPPFNKILPDSQMSPPINNESEIPSPKHCENNVNPGNPNSELGNELTLTSHPVTDLLSDSLKFGWDGDALTDCSGKVPKNKIAPNIKPMKKNAARVRVGAKFDFSIRRCIRIFQELPELQDCDVHHVASIFKNDQNREIFITLKRNQRISWLKREMEERTMSRN